MPISLFGNQESAIEHRYSCALYLLSRHDAPWQHVEWLSHTGHRDLRERKTSLDRLCDLRNLRLLLTVVKTAANILENLFWRKNGLVIIASDELRVKRFCFSYGR